jgi:DNA modification methylase
VSGSTRRSPARRASPGSIQRVCSALPRFASESVDFVLTDPPYVHRYRSNDGRVIPNDRFKWLKPAFAELHRVLKPDSFCVCFYAWAHIDKFAVAFRQAGFRVVGHLTFPKRYTSGTRFLRYQHESAYLLAKGEPQPPCNPIGRTCSMRSPVSV